MRLLRALPGLLRMSLLDTGSVKMDERKITKIYSKTLRNIINAEEEASQQEREKGER